LDGVTETFYEKAKRQEISLTNLRGAQFFPRS